MEWSVQDEKGRFKRTVSIWTPENFDASYVDKKGYFICYRPDYPRCYSGRDYARRSHVVWWIATGNAVPYGFDIHHKNKNKLDDRIENFELLTHGEHSHEHNPIRIENGYASRVCQNYEQGFKIKKGRLRDSSRGKYCSQKCYQRTRASKIILFKLPE